MEKRRNCSYAAISPLFHNIFNVSLTSVVMVVKLHIRLWNVVVRFIFSSILQIWYVEIRISRSISESPLDFEITRVDLCKYHIYFEYSNKQTRPNRMRRLIRVHTIWHSSCSTLTQQQVVNHLYTDTRYNDKFIIMIIWMTRNFRLTGDN